MIVNWFRKNKNFFTENLRRNLLILLSFSVIIAFGVRLVHIRLLQNTQKMGTYLTYNYAAQEQNNITIYETLIELGMEYIDQQVQDNATPEEFQQWIYTLFENTSKMLNDPFIDMYAVIDGKLIAANPWEGDSTYDYQSTDWYQSAIKGDGKTVFTDCYRDVVTGQMITTIVKKSQNSENVLAFDVFLNKLRTYSNPSMLPEGGSYYLCDRSGTPIYYQSTLTDTSFESIESYVKSLAHHIHEDNLANYNDKFIDPDGTTLGVYYHEMNNGWISILTIPFQTILHELIQFISVFSVLFFAFFLFIFLTAIRDYRLSRKFTRAGETVQVLGNSYYAIYRINYKDGTYEEIKSAPDIQQKIPKVGSYHSLLREIRAVVDDNTFQDFSDSFSLENIRRLVSSQTHDFGGDYLRHFDDCDRWVNVRLLFDDSLLNTDEAVLCFQEVDQEKKEQLVHLELMESALEAAQNSEKAKNIFFSTMSHDMRTPLNAIIGLSELAQQNLKNTDKLSDYIEKILFSSHHLLDLINDLLDISHLEHDKISLDYEAMDLRNCIETCSGFFHTLANKEEKTFEVTFDLQNSVVLGDAFRISQIINNLLANAFKYSDAGASICLNVKQIFQENHNCYQIVVADTGIGISEEFLPMIFESYAREARFSSRGVVGTGLGMPIVKRLVQHMNGSITVKSELGKGSTFFVTLPLQPVDAPISPVSDTLHPLSNVISGAHVLLAEDNEINMEIASEILALQGITVTRAWNGREAVECFKNSSVGYYDAILMDMLMPEMGGCDASRAIRALDREDALLVPIIAVTANAFAEDIALTAQFGMNTHIAKPIDFNLLCQTLSTLIHNYRDKLPTTEKSTQ